MQHHGEHVQWQWCEAALPEFYLQGLNILKIVHKLYVQVSTKHVQCAKPWTTHVQWQWCDDAHPEFYYGRQASFCAQLLNFN